MTSPPTRPSPTRPPGQALLRAAAACLAAAAPLLAPARGEDPGQDGVLAKAAAEYGFTAGKDRTAELAPKPLLTWTNPQRNTPDGALFLWTWGGRPQAVACVYTYGEGNADIDHEFHSLAAEVLVARRNGKVVWEPPGPGVEFKEVPQAPAPADTEAKRLGQMRAVARGFTASVGPEGDRHELRLLPQPVYRYPGGDGRVPDGAIFALVQATDPEVLLLLEARRAEGEGRWHYALARMSDLPLEVGYGGGGVWKAERWSWERRKDQPSYIKFTEKVKR
jgi:hypothetical protein